MKKHKSDDTPARRYVAKVGTLSITQLHLRNPWITAWWSAAFPGLGHILLSQHLIGFLLFLFEVFINYKSNLNLAILYSFTGRFEFAKEILNINWLLLYVPVYIFSIWDSYRRTVDINHQYILAKRENVNLNIFRMDTMCFNYLDKKSPLAAAMWSFLMPGIGQLYIHKIINAFFAFIWWIINVYYSRVLLAIHLSFVGKWDEVISVVNPHWLLNIPSIYLFSIYGAYFNAVENNKLFDCEQKNFFLREYDNKCFKIPFKMKNKRGENVYILSTFGYSNFLELAVGEIEEKYVNKENIIIIPMDKKNEEPKPFDLTHSSNGFNLIDLAAILGSIFMVLGTIYGFILKWGPIWWGLIGLGFGLAVGLIIKVVKSKKSLDMKRNKSLSEVVIIIMCKKEQAEGIKDTLWSHNALGVSELNLVEPV